jgi:hypothetical protein
VLARRVGIRRVSNARVKRSNARAASGQGRAGRVRAGGPEGRAGPGPGPGGLGRESQNEESPGPPHRRCAWTSSGLIPERPIGASGRHDAPARGTAAALQARRGASSDRWAAHTWHTWQVAHVTSMDDGVGPGEAGRRAGNNTQASVPAFPEAEIRSTSCGEEYPDFRDRTAFCGFRGIWRRGFLHVLGRPGRGPAKAPWGQVGTLGSNDA